MLVKFEQVNLQKKIRLGRPRRIWEDNIRMDFKEVGINTRNCVVLAHYIGIIGEPL